MPRRAGVEGTVKETPRKGSGVWIALLPPSLSGGKRTAIEGRFATKTEARAELRRQITDRERGLGSVSRPRGSGPPRKVREVVAEYIDHRAGSASAPLAAKTVEGYRSVLRVVINHEQANIGDYPVSRLSTADISRWMDQLTAALVTSHQVKAGRRLLSAALGWEVRRDGGWIHVNPAAGVRAAETSKARRAMETNRDPVLIPSWEELAVIAAHPERHEDRLLIALMAWGGLRWSEAASLPASALWRDEPRVTVEKVWMKGANGWVLEAVKQGTAATVALPTPLWTSLLELAQTRQDQVPGERNLLFRTAHPRNRNKPSARNAPVGIIDSSNWRKTVWEPARLAAGLGPDLTRPSQDPHRAGIKIKDLRAACASFFVDAGATIFETAVALRHADVKTTSRYYTRAVPAAGHDPGRTRLRMEPSMTLPQRIDALWAAWAEEYPDQVGRVVPRVARDGGPERAR